MSQGTRECPKCKAEIPAASMRCVECGARVGLVKTEVNNPTARPITSQKIPATSEQNELSIEDMMTMADQLSNVSAPVNKGKPADQNSNYRKAALPKPIIKRPQIDPRSIPPAPANVTNNPGHTEKSASVPTVGTPSLRRPVRPNQNNPVVPPGKVSTSSETQTSSSDSSLVSKHGEQDSSSQSSIIKSTQSSDASSRSGVTRKRKRTSTESGNASGVFSQEALGNKSTRGSKRVLGNSTHEISLITNEELQHAIRTSVNQPEPEIAPLAANKEDQSKKKKAPTAAQLQKQAQKLAAKIELIKDDDTKTSLDTTRETLKELSSYGIPDVVNHISPYIHDTRPTIGDSATKALGESRQPSALPFILKQLMSTEKSRVASAIISLGALGDRRAVLPLIVTALEFPQFSLRVMDSVEQIGDAGVPSLIELAQHQELGICLNATIALGKLKDQRGMEVLVHLLDHESMNVRCHAAEALGEIGNKKCTSSLVKKLTDEKSQVRVNAVVALGKLADEDAAIGLLRCLKDSDEDVVAQAAIALGNCNGKIAIEPLQKLLGSSNDKIVLSACAALGKIGNAQTAQAMTKLLYLPESPSESQFILEVIDAVRKLKSPHSVPGLIDILDASDAAVRQRTVEALGYIADSQAAIPLENLFEQEKSDEVRAAIIKALGEIGDHDSFDVIVKALDDMMLVRIKAVIALGQLKDEASLMYLTPMLNDPSPELRYHSCSALAEIGKKTVIHQIEPLVLDENNLVQRGALKALQKLGDERPEKEILKSAKKRAPKKSKAPAVSLALDFSSFVPDSMVGLVSPDNPMMKWIALGGASSVLILLLGIGAYMFWPKPVVVMRMGYLRTVDLGVDGSTISLGRTFGVVQLVNGEGRKELVRLPIQPDSIEGVLNLGNNHFMATVGGNVVDINNGTITNPDGFSTSSKIVKFKPTMDGSHFYTLDATNALRIYDTSTLKNKSTLALPPGSPAISVANNGELIASAPAPGTVVIQKGDGSLFYTLTHPLKSNGLVSALAFSPDQKLLFASFTDNSLVSWSMETGKINKIMGTKQAGNVPVKYFSMNFSSDPNILICIGNNASHKWNVTDNKIIATGPALRSIDISFSRDAKKAAFTQDEDTLLYVIDLDEFATINELRIPSQ